MQYVSILILKLHFIERDLHNLRGGTSTGILCFPRNTMWSLTGPVTTLGQTEWIYNVVSIGYTLISKHPIKSQEVGLNKERVFRQQTLLSRNILVEGYNKKPNILPKPIGFYTGMPVVPVSNSMYLGYSGT